MQTLDGDLLSKSEYIEYIESIREFVAGDAQTYIFEEVRNIIFDQKK